MPLSKSVKKLLLIFCPRRIYTLYNERDVSSVGRALDSSRCRGFDSHTFLFCVTIIYHIIKFFLKGEIAMKKYTFGHMVFDFIMTMATGGMWLIWVLVRYLRTH